MRLSTAARLAGTWPGEDAPVLCTCPPQAPAEAAHRQAGVTLGSDRGSHSLVVFLLELPEGGKREVRRGHGDTTPRPRDSRPQRLLHMASAKQVGRLISAEPQGKAQCSTITQPKTPPSGTVLQGRGAGYQETPSEKARPQSGGAPDTRLWAGQREETQGREHSVQGGSPGL